MTEFVCSTNSLLQDAAARLNGAAYAEIPWDRTECAAIAAEALRCAAAALCSGEESVIHPLGFARIPLSSWTLERPRIAVHVWSSDWQAVHALDIHDHCYNFVSICIAGKIHHGFFEPCHSADACVYNALHYQAGSCGESEGAPGEGHRLALVNEQTVAVHDALSLHHSRLHQTKLLTDVAVTVQFQSPCLKPSARVFRAVGANPPIERVTVEPLSRERIALLLERLSR